MWTNCTGRGRRGRVSSEVRVLLRIIIVLLRMVYSLKLMNGFQKFAVSIFQTTVGYGQLRL